MYLKRTETHSTNFQHCFHIDRNKFVSRVGREYQLTETSMDSKLRVRHYLEFQFSFREKRPSCPGLQDFLRFVWIFK